MEREVFGIFLGVKEGWEVAGRGLVGVAYGVLCGKNTAVGLQHTQIWIKVV